MERDHFSRREFLQALGLGVPAGISLFSGFQLANLYPFIPYLLTSEHGPVSPENFESLLNVEVTAPLAIKENGLGRLFEVSFDKKEGAKALYEVAETMMPKGGPSKLFEVLMAKPLEIMIQPGKSMGRVVRGEAAIIYGENLRFLFRGGPAISFYKDMAADYLAALEGENPDDLKEVDRVIIHECAHVMQDVKNPFAALPEAVHFGIQDMLSQFGIVPEPIPMALDYEEEARDIASRVVDRRQNQYQAEFPVSSWPFGHFFKFTEV